MAINPAIERWVNDVRAITRADHVVYCDGSEAERARLVRECLASGELIELNQQKLPGCYLHRSAPHDVARTEHLTFICTSRRDDAGPTNNWMSPVEARAKVTPLLSGSMAGRTMFVVPFLMGPPGSKFSKVGVEITDSRYVVPNMRIMTRMGQVALDQLGGARLHEVPALAGRPQPRAPLHRPLPGENAVWSVGSGYGGNALLGKKCMALRLASWMARREGWLAEHMLILGLKTPEGRQHYVAGAFPSACGKTNLAMLVPPSSMPGWEARTIGDDIAWLRPGADGRLWAINPEAGFFGVAPGTSHKTNPTAFDMVRRNTIYTNVALRKDGTPWWEGHDDPPPTDAADWQGRPWSPGSSEKAAHPNSRFTTPASECATPLAGVREPTACRSTRSSSARGVSVVCRWSTRRGRGSTARSSAPRSRQRPPPPPPGRSACCGATRWRCCPSAVTTWGTTGGIGSTWAARCARRRTCSASTGSAREKTGGCSGRGSARTCAC
jgi:phosphoenolpyruvate carboxykinase (GTP)